MLITQEPVALLTVAINHSRLHIIRLLLEKYPNIMLSPGSNDAHSHILLKAAVCSKNNGILEVLLKYTPKVSELLIQAINDHHTLLTQSTSCATIIRLLNQHFTPLSAEARSWLIAQSCAVGDITLLEELSKTEPIFSHRIADANGYIPT
jgi:hypothetical protein